MRYLRMLTNSLVAGLLGAAYLTVLILQLNPSISRQPPAVVPIFATLVVFHGVHLAAAFYALVVLRQIVTDVPHSPGWLSVRLLAWLSAGTALAAAALTWINVRGYATALPPDAARRMAAGAVALSVVAVLLVALAVGHYSFGRRGSRVSAALLAIAIAASLLLPVHLRGPGRGDVARDELAAAARKASPDGPRVVMILLDGASLDYIAEATSRGRLPNLGTIVDAGASMHLATIRPTHPGPVWTTVATGKYGPKHGVRSAATYRSLFGGDPIELLPDHAFLYTLVRLGLLTEAPHDSSSVDSRPLWEILSARGIAVGIVGWPLTYPAAPVRGYLVSDRLHLFARSPLSFDDRAVGYPPDVVDTGLALGAADVQPAELAPVAAAIQHSSELDTLPLGRDEFYARIAEALEREHQPHFTAVRYQGLDLLGHLFLRYAMPRSFGDVTELERERYGAVLERYYAYIDGIVGRAMVRLHPGDLLLVVSGFGLEPVSLGRRLLARATGGPALTGTHDTGPDGFMLGYGTAVAPGRLPVGSLTDVAPTVLYYFGLPVGRDMDGYARADMFVREFTAERPLTFIPTHD